MRPASGAVTIAHVAAAAQVSVRTVSRVLNQASNVDDRTRETVITVIEQPGFRRNSRACGCGPAGVADLILPGKSHRFCIG
jgi:LacI family transcriptional regulator